MKRPSSVSFVCEKRRDWLLTLLLILVFGAPCLAALPQQNVIHIAQAEFIISDAATIPAADAGWEPVALPHRSPKPADRELVGYWYRATFVKPVSQDPLWLFFPKLRSGGAIYVNGVQIGAIRSADQQHQVRWFRPHLFFVPPLSLREGSNEIAVRFAIREPLTSFGEFSVGAEQPLRAAFNGELWWEATSTDITSVVCVLAGTLILLLWMRRRQEALYGLFGLCVLSWGLRTFIFRMPEVSMDWWLIWRFFYYLTTAGFITSITIFLLRFSQFKQPRLERFLVAYWLGGSFIFLLVGPSARLVMDTYWIGSYLPFTVFSIVRLIIFAARQRMPSGIAMVLAILFALSLALHDYAVQHGMFGVPEFYLLHLGIPAFLLVMALVLLDHFIDSLRQAESINEQLARRIKEREDELTASYRTLSKFERRHATTEERQRIMQEIHDGVGSQLLSTLVMVQRGVATQNDTVVLLQQCLDDMRLAIDSLSPHEPDLVPVLGNFRFRMESRFKSLGLTLRWRNHDMPDTLDISPHAGLQILRILQEALTNVLKHTNGSNVDVDLMFTEERLRIRVKDDGAGALREAGKTSGYGVTNMRVRAQKIGATLSVEHLATGTTVDLDIPVAALQAAVVPE